MRSVLVIALLITSACSSVGRDPATVDTVRDCIDRLVEADNHSNLDTVMESYTSDAVLVPPSGERVVGRDAIRAHYKKLFETWIPNLKAKHLRTTLSHGRGYDKGHTVGTLFPLKTGGPKSVDDVYEANLRFEDGKLRVWNLKWSPSPQD